LVDEKAPLASDSVFKILGSSQLSSSSSRPRIVLDSGASLHVTPNAGFIRDLRPLEEAIPLKGAFEDRPVFATFWRW
jgi:hypothetical protein